MALYAWDALCPFESLRLLELRDVGKVGCYALTLSPRLCTNSFKNDQFAPFSFLNIGRDERLFFFFIAFCWCQRKHNFSCSTQNRIYITIPQNKENLWYSEWNQKWFSEQKHLYCNYDHTGGFYIIMLLESVARTRSLVPHICFPVTLLSICVANKHF